MALHLLAGQCRRLLSTIVPVSCQFDVNPRSLTRPRPGQMTTRLQGKVLEHQNKVSSRAWSLLA